MTGNQEYLSIDPERGPRNPESKIESRPDIIERLDTQITTPEILSKDIENNTEKAREEALEIAKSIESNDKEKEKTEKNQIPHHHEFINKKQLSKSYSQTLSQVQNDLPANSRIFSKIIHNKYIEKTSDITSKTIARPNAILAGAFAAFVLTLLTYTIAKTIGYNLSGFETIAAFIVGWIIGIVFDFLRVIITSNKS